MPAITSLHNAYSSIPYLDSHFPCIALLKILKIFHPSPHPNVVILELTTSAESQKKFLLYNIFVTLIGTLCLCLNIILMMCDSFGVKKV